MKIVHVCLCGPVTDNWTYQDNLLPKYHKMLGHNVFVITSQFIWTDSGDIGFDLRDEYINEYGIKTYRLKCNKDNVNNKFKKFYGIYELLKEIMPDIIFVHGCQFVDIRQVVKYAKKNNNTKIYVDNHADYSNSATNWLSKNILHKHVWKYFAKLIKPYVTKFYGVLPSRVDFLVDLYKLPKEKCELLVMGADDEMVQKNNTPEVRASVREQYGISDDDILIVTGGKIDAFKKQTLLLMDAVNDMSSDVKLIVFGSVVPELKNEVERRCTDKVKYIGWLSSDDTYKHFAACDFAVFPGRHSVIWEQVAGQGIPLIVKYWEGTTHINICGNAEFLYQDTEKDISNAIKKVIKNYAEKKKAAVEVSYNFLYSEISRRSIEN